jgi:hypothetical protein
VATVEFDRTVRGVEVTIFADRFTEDLSVGMFLGPEEISAETRDGKPFDLTSEEEEKLGSEATEIFLARDQAAEEAELKHWFKGG